MVLIKKKIIENDIPLFISLIEGGYDFSYEKYKYLRDVFSQFDIVHFHSFSILKFLALIDCKVVYTIHGLSKGVRSENFFKFHLRESIKKYFLNKVDFFISNSNYTMDLSKKHYGLKAIPKEVILNGTTKNITYEKNTNSNDTFTVGLVSRFTPRKRIEYLVNAFNEFIKMGGNGKLTIVGDGETFESVKKLVKRFKIENLTNLVGYSSDVGKYYKLFDICVFPSKKEPFGLVGIEAYSYGKPVLVLKDSGGLKEIIEPIEPENIVENVKELALRLFYYYENRNEIVNKSNIRKSYVENNFSIDRMMKDYQRIYLRFFSN